MKWLILILLLAACTQHAQVSVVPADTVCFEEHCIEVELAETDYQQAMGLSFRENLDPGKGMLFIFSTPGIYQFWMKNTLIPLDMVWIDSSGRVVYIEENAQPCQPDYCPTIDPGKIAKYVLEVNGGVTSQIGLEEGDYVSINLV